MNELDGPPPTLQKLRQVIQTPFKTLDAPPSKSLSYPTGPRRSSAQRPPVNPGSSSHFHEVPNMNTHLFSKLLPTTLSSRILAAACFAAALALTLPLASTTLRAADKPADSQPAKEIKITGTCLFSGKPGTWSATLTPKSDGLYDAKYLAAWSDRKAMTYEGQIKTDLKTTISGTGKSTGGGGNGTFEFAGKFDDKGVATCPYKEVKGGRSGTLTVDSIK